MHRFFIPRDCINDAHVLFKKDIARQMTHVLRLNPGDHVIALDNSGKEFETEITHIGDVVEGKVISCVDNHTELSIPLTLFFSLSQREKVEWILQKCTEIGVARFIPFISSRSLVQQEHIVEQKRDRWEAIIREAAEQSGRGLIPVLSKGVKFFDAIGYGPTADLAIIAWEGEKNTSITQVHSRKENSEVALMIGPEGGFSSDEIQIATDSHWIPVSLGKRIMRMETAAIAACAILASLSEK